eukprot:3387530-Rhodomonas_salina.5
MMISQRTHSSRSPSLPACFPDIQDKLPPSPKLAAAQSATGSGVSLAGRISCCKRGLTDRRHASAQAHRLGLLFAKALRRQPANLLCPRSKFPHVRPGPGNR